MDKDNDSVHYCDACGTNNYKSVMVFWHSKKHGERTYMCSTCLGLGSQSANNTLLKQSGIDVQRGQLVSINTKSVYIKNKEKGSNTFKKIIKLGEIKECKTQLNQQQQQ